MAKTILVVDDSVTMVMSLRSTLTLNGFQVESAGNGREALDKLAAGLKPDLIVTDVNMPVMTGVELYRHLRDSGHAIPTILVTAYADDDVGSRALRDGVLGYLRKPVDEKHLKQCLLAALPRRGQPDD